MGNVAPLTDRNADAGDSELVIAVIGALGTDLGRVEELLAERLRQANYGVEAIHVSRDVIPLCADVPDLSEADEAARIRALMKAGNDARRSANDSSVLALGAAREIWQQRTTAEGSVGPMPRRAWVINSIKHPDEVHRLRQIYPQGFYLLGVHCSPEDRLTYLHERKEIDKCEAQKLMEQDESEEIGHGQHTVDAFHLADFFIGLDSKQDDRLRRSIWRIVELLFGNPKLTPTFDEYAMFMAFSAALRSADLSRQIGAVVAKEQEILSTGANDCPRAGGGLYWPELNERKGGWEDIPKGRDYTRGCDSNKMEQKRILTEILDLLEIEVGERERALDQLARSSIRELTEYGRVVHAEMEALLCCARNGTPTRGATLYCTTFPCHNCAKHIVASGIQRVVYIEPYPKSKALQFHDESITNAFGSTDGRVRFEPFIGVGPRRFFDLFSMALGSGYRLVRKNKQGKAVDWELKGNSPRIAMAPRSYLDLETEAVERLQCILDNDIRRHQDGSP
jgi:deoxycytidylate deaminase